MEAREQLRWMGMDQALDQERLASSDRPVKILVIYENGAGGHRTSARAIAEALGQFPNVSSATLELDTLAPKMRKTLYSASIDVRLALRPVVRFAFGFGLYPNPILSINRKIEGLVEPFIMRRFLDVVREESPDLIVSTHFRPTIACNTWLARGQIKVPVYSVIPDFMAHGLYAHPRISGYFVASEAAKDDLIGHGVDGSRVHVTGLPVSLAMGRVPVGSQEEAKTKLGLHPELPMILVMGGARGDQDYETILRTMERSTIRAQAAILCGWNTSLKDELDIFARTLKTSVVVKGFQSNMADWYRAADLILTKGGSMTPAEAMAMGKALLVSGVHPGKEEVQTARLAKAGVFLYESDPQRAAEAALRLLADPVEKKRMEARAAAFQSPDASLHIAKALVDAARGWP